MRGLEEIKTMNEVAAREQSKLFVRLDIGEGKTKRGIEMTLSEAKSVWNQLNKLFSPKPVKMDIPEEKFHQLVPPSINWQEFDSACREVCGCEPMGDQFPTVAITADNAPAVVEPFYDNN